VKVATGVLVSGLSSSAFPLNIVSSLLPPPHWPAGYD
jgi:hypothetical protein